MQRHILKKAVKMSVVILLLALSFLVISTTTHAAALSARISHTSTQAATNCLFLDQEVYSVAVVTAYATCLGGQPVSYTATASTHIPASDCDTIASVTSTIWGYYSGSYHIMAREGTNNTCFGTSEQVAAQCGVIYHAESEVTRWWWAGPPWDAVVNTATFSFC